MDSTTDRAAPGRGYLAAAFLVLGGAALLASYYTGSRIVHLQRYGLVAEGTVVRIQSEVKGLRSAIVRYTIHDGGNDMVAKDLLRSQFVDPNDVGDQVTVHYDPSNPSMIVVDRGGWEWLNAAFLALGALVCFVLALVFARSPLGAQR